MRTITKLLESLSALLEAKEGVSFSGIALPRVRQQAPSSCGSASLLSVLKYFGKADPKATDKTAQAALGFTDSGNGADVAAIEAAAKLAGLKTTREYDSDMASLLSHVDAGHPAIVCIQAWPTNGSKSLTKHGHYSVVIGSDEDNLYLMDPADASGNGYVWVPKAEFDEVWTTPYAELDRAFIAVSDKKTAEPEDLTAGIRLQTPRTPE